MQAAGKLGVQEILDLYRAHTGKVRAEATQSFQDEMTLRKTAGHGSARDPWGHRRLPRPPPPAPLIRAAPAAGPFVDKPKPATPEGALLEVKLGSRLDAI